MKLGNIFEDALKFPFSNNRRFFGFGGIYLAYHIILQLLLMLNINLGAYIGSNPLIIAVSSATIVILLLFITGYQIKIIKESINGAPELPALENWIDMFVDGIKISVALIVYNIIPGFLLGISIAPLIDTLISGNIPTGNEINWILLVIALILLAVIYVLYFMIMANFAHKSSFRSAFALGEILEKIKSFGCVNYILFVILLVLIEAIIMVVSMMVSLVPVLGLIISGLIIAPFLLIFESRAVGSVYRKSIK